MIAGVYLGQSPERVAASVRLLRYYRDFLASDSAHCRHPESEPWRCDTLTKPAARARLKWLIDVAINRKAGVPDERTDWSLIRFARAVNTPRLRVYRHDCPGRYRSRLEHRLTNLGEDA